MFRKGKARFSPFANFAEHQLCLCGKIVTSRADKISFSCGKFILTDNAVCAIRDSTIRLSCTLKDIS